MGQDQSRANGTQAVAADGRKADGAAGSGVAGSHGSTVATVPLKGIEGFQVVRLLPYSPAHKAGLVPYFDIITSLDHVLLESEGKPALQFFKNYIASHQDQPVCFTVFNLHIRAYRDVYCVPSDAWGGGGLLGCSIEWSRAEACPERCIHIVDVLEGSPAAFSGELRADRDYILGMQTAQEPLISLIKNQKDFYMRLEGWHEEQRWALERRQRFPSEAVDVPHILLFLIYNSENNTVKEVAVEMGTNPEAALGMSVATGLLHVIPSAATAGDAATATSLPVMNKFVRLEANSAVTSTPDADPSTSLPSPLLPPPAPSDAAAAEGGVQLFSADDAHGDADVHHHGSQPALEQRGGVGAEDSLQMQLAESAREARQQQQQQQQAVAAAAAANSAYYPHNDDAPPPQQGFSAFADDAPPYPFDPAPPLPPQPPMAHAYPSPPMATHGDFIPPPRMDAGQPPAAPMVTPPPTPPRYPASAVATPHPAASTKKSPFHSALASVMAYEHLPPPAAAALEQPEAPNGHAPHHAGHPTGDSGMAYAGASQGCPPATASPSAQPSPSGENSEQPGVTRAAVTTPYVGGDAPKASPPPLPSQTVPNHSTYAPPQPAVAFSMTNMPPPLHFPVFRGAAVKLHKS